ncbi:MAG: UDP-3-O-(3-hydroxymyristoyl)glucosamine N-acyltransferase [Syntrophomonadaceae bacterium]|nr:UDP-3-O-(3-hydroxymyristoyl)glucosamine N-acyltransferase [Syntrophomonadaceae bacterium]
MEKMNYSFNLSDVISFLNSNDLLKKNICFENDFSLYGFSSIFETTLGTISWASSKKKSLVDWSTINCSVIVCDQEFEKEFENILQNVIYLPVDNPRKVFIKLLKHFYPEKKLNGIEKTAIISENCKLGKDVYIGHFVIIEDNVQIGDNTIIHNNVYIHENTRIGSNCIIHSGAKIGIDGFGYEKQEDGTYEKFLHIGGVTIGDNVEIKSNTCINRGTLSNTVIKKNVKINDLCHIAHNVIIGEATIITSGCSIGGSTKIGRNCWIAPRVAIREGLTIHDNVLIGYGSVVVKSIEKECTIIGVPAKPLKKGKD